VIEEFISWKIDNRKKLFAPHMVAKGNQSLHNSESEFDKQKLDWADMGHILYSTNTA
jgi:hypothetical protein